MPAALGAGRVHHPYVEESPPAALEDVRSRAKLPGQAETPYVDALSAYARRDPARLHTPGHKGGASGSGPLPEAVGERALEMDIPVDTHGIDVGVHPTPIQHAEALAAKAWGAKRTWFLANGASEGNHAACLALARKAGQVVVQRNAHASTMHGLVLSGLGPTFIAPEVDVDLGIAHCLTSEALDRALAHTPDPAGALVVSPTYYGAAADLRSLVEVAHAHGVALVVDEAWGAHFPFHDSLPEGALAVGADLVISSTHKIVGSLTQSAMLHLGYGAEDRLSEEDVLRALAVVGSTSPNSLLLGSLDAARSRAAVDGQELLDDVIETAQAARAEVATLPGLRPLDEGLVGRLGVHAYDPLRLAIDVRGTGFSGYELALTLRRLADINLELVEQDVIVALFGMEETLRADGERLVEALRQAVGVLDRHEDQLANRSLVPPAWGPPAMAPRTAFLAPYEVVPAQAAVGRVAAESMAVYPPGIPNLLPGERLTAETLAYMQSVLDQGGRVRGATDPTMRTFRVVSDTGTIWWRRSDQAKYLAASALAA